MKKHGQIFAEGCSTCAGQKRDRDYCMCGCSPAHPLTGLAHVSRDLLHVHLHGCGFVVPAHGCGHQAFLQSTGQGNVASCILLHPLVLTLSQARNHPDARPPAQARSHCRAEKPRFGLGPGQPDKSNRERTGVRKFLTQRCLYATQAQSCNRLQVHLHTRSTTSFMNCCQAAHSTLLLNSSCTRVAVSS